MNDLPLVSIVTPSYNQGQYLEQTIQSVLRQDYPRIEYLVIDGGSTDNSVDIIQKYEGRLAYWISEPDGGQTEALIKGFERAKGDLIGWLCSDDLLEPSMVSQSVSYHLTQPEIGLTFGDRIRIDTRGNSYSFERYPSFRKWSLYLGFSIPQETVLMKRSVFDLAGGLDHSLQMAMDTDLWMRAARISRIVHIPAFLGRFRAHEDNKSTHFTNQLTAGGFEAGFPAEYAEVYRRYYSSYPEAWKIKAGKTLQVLLGFLERRVPFYRKQQRILAEIRRDGIKNSVKAMGGNTAPDDKSFLNEGPQ